MYVKSRNYAEACSTDDDGMNFVEAYQLSWLAVEQTAVRLADRRTDGRTLNCLLGFAGANGGTRDSTACSVTLFVLF